MSKKFVIDAIRRYEVETLPLIEQLTDEMIFKKPVPGMRETGEIILHMIRSSEYYLNGLVNDSWSALPYGLDVYNKAEKIIELFRSVSEKTHDLLDKLHDMDMDVVEERFNRPASKLEILAEMLEHNIHHRAQIMVYYHLFDLSPKLIPYII